MSDWPVAVGTLLLAFIAAFQDWIRSKIWCPILDCELKLEPPDCHMTISKYPIEPHSITIPTPYGTARTIEVKYNHCNSFYYRFKIWNKGKVSAKHIEVIITDILKYEGKEQTFKRIISFSPDNLLWSTTGEVYMEYISPNTFKYVNLGHIHDPKHRNLISGEDNPYLNVSENESIFCFDVKFRSNILYYLIKSGEYNIEIKVGCENAKTITKKYKINFNGKWFENESEMLSKGFKISELN